MTFKFHPEAEKEFFEAIEFYENRETGLGEFFAIEVNFTIQNIQRHPGAWPLIEDNIRRCLVHRFPYGILYAIEDNELFILAVMHLHRSPDYWKNRF